MTKQIHHRSNSFNTTIYYGTKSVAVCSRINGQWQVGLATPTGPKYFIRPTLQSVKDACLYYLEGAA